MPLPPQNFFQYTPLSPGNATIRLLTLRVDGRKGLYCELWEECLDNPSNLGRSYAALSYMWGSEIASRRWVMLNEKPFHIQPNLYDALLAIKNQAHDDVVLWVDAISINQYSLAERGQQVGLMGRIYRGACRVWAWLGPAIEGSDAVFDTLNGITQDSTERLEQKREDLENSKEALLTLCDSEYFSRAWVQQELFLAGDNGVLLCGDKQVPWKIFSVACAINPTIRGKVDHTWARLLLHRTSEVTLQELITNRTPLLKCSDNRDRIFSLLSIATDLQYNRRMLIADYSISDQGLFFSVIGMCKPEFPAALATGLATKLKTRWIDLFDVVYNAQDPEQPPRIARACKSQECSIWVEQALESIQKFRSDRSAQTMASLLKSPEPESLSLEDEGKRIGVQRRGEIDRKLFGHIAKPGDNLFALGDTDIAMLLRESIFGPYVIAFARTTGANEYTEYSPSDIPSGDPKIVDRALLGIRSSAGRLTYGEYDQTGSIGSWDEHVDYFESYRKPENMLTILESLRSSGHLCGAFCMGPDFKFWFGSSVVAILGFHEWLYADEDSNDRKLGKLP